MSQFAGFGKEFGSSAQGVSTKETQILEVPVEKIIEVEKIVEVEKIIEKPVIVEKIVESVKLVEVEIPHVVERVVIEKIPVETVMEKTTIEPSLKAEEELLKVCAELAKLNKKLDDAQSIDKTNKKFMWGALCLILLSQILGFFL